VINQEQFKTLQNTFKDVAKRSSNLYFAVVDLVKYFLYYRQILNLFINSHLNFILIYLRDLLKKWLQPNLKELK